MEWTVSHRDHLTCYYTYLLAGHHPGVLVEKLRDGSLIARKTCI